MLTTSTEFEEALEAEFERLVAERIAEYCETGEFYERLDKAVDEELAKCDPFFAGPSSGETLRLFMSPENSDSMGYIDIEKAIDKELNESDPEHWQYVLGRLEAMAEKLRGALSHNAQVTGASPALMAKRPVD